jgi:hypothetical protein
MGAGGEGCPSSLRDRNPLQSLGSLEECPVGRPDPRLGESQFDRGFARVGREIRLPGRPVRRPRRLPERDRTKFWGHGGPDTEHVRAFGCRREPD